MKRTAHFVPLLVLAVAALAQTQPAKVGSGRRAPPAAPNGTLVIGANDMVGGVAEPGWPLIIAATGMPNAGAPAALPAAFNLRLNAASGGEINVRFEFVPPLAARPTSHYWLVAESATAQLTPGTYRIAPAAGQSQLTGWRVEPGELRIVAPDPARKGSLPHLRIHRLMLLGNTDDALTAADQLTRESATDSEAWIAKGDIHMIKAQPAEALEAYDRALKLEENSGREPIAIMTRRRDAFQRLLERQGVVVPSPAPR